MGKYQEEINVLLPLVEKVGNKIMEIYSSDYEIMQKENESPVTKADLLSNEMLINGLKKFGYAVISEESENDKTRFENERCWVIDPLDGTKDFIQKTGEFSIMIGLLENNKPVLGVVYAPALDKLFYAEKDEGAFMLKKDSIVKLNVNENNDISSWTMVRSRNHFTEKEQQIADNAGIKEFEKLGSIGIKLCEIALNKAQISMSTYTGLGEWDLCAPYIILQEAGGEVYDMQGKELQFNTKEMKMSKGYIATCKTSKENKDKILSVF